MTTRRHRSLCSALAAGMIVSMMFVVAGPVAAQSPGSGLSMGVAWGSQRLTRASELVPTVIRPEFFGFRTYSRVFPDINSHAYGLTARYWWPGGLSIGGSYRRIDHRHSDSAEADGSGHSATADVRYSLTAIEGPLRPFLAANGGYRAYDIDVGIPLTRIETDVSAWTIGWDLGLEVWATRHIAVEAAGTFRGLRFSTVTGPEPSNPNAVAEGSTGTEWGWRVGAHVLLW